MEMKTKHFDSQPSTTDSAAVSLNAARPVSIKEFVGQDHLKALIRTAVDSSRHRNAPVPHSLITGAAGLGKTSLARLIAIERGVSFIATAAEAMSIEFSPHSLRHWFACEADASGASVEAIRLALWHSGLGTTQKYLNRVRRGINEAFAKVKVPKLG